ncbi:MAG: succinylglutamate desuccinylase/aspartoacylase family protein, partial [Clostridium sp.]
MHKKKLRFFTIWTFMILLVFSSFIYVKKNTDRKIVKLMVGTPVETSYCIVEGTFPGKTIFVIGGTHGDEIAGWKAAEQLKKMKAPKSGTLIILSPANAPGCKNNQRNVEPYRDLNRSFPGDKNRDLTDQLASSIYKTILETSPDLVIDLHEAYREKGNRDFLGNSIIFTDLTGIEELVSYIIEETQSGALCTKPFSYYGPAPVGSLNYEVTQGLHIPVITIETSKEDPLKERINNHIQLVKKSLEVLQEL